MRIFTTLLTVFGLCFFTINAFAQPRFFVIPRDADATSGDQVIVDIKTDQFENMATIQFSLNWDPALLDYVTVGDLNTDLGLIPPPAPVNFLVAQTGMGRLGFTYIEPSLAGATLNMGDTVTLFSLTLELLDDAGNVEFINFGDQPLAREIFQRSGGMDVDVTDDTGFAGGPATQAGYNNTGPQPNPDVCTGTTGLTQITAYDTIPPGTQTCLDVYMCNFQDVSGFSYTIEFDPAKIRFDSIASINLENLEQGSFNTLNAASGTINAAWFSTPAISISIPDGTPIYQICYTAVGMEGEVDSVKFTSLQTPLQAEGPGGSNIPFTAEAGIVAISSGGGTVSVNVGEESAVQGDEVCVDITVGNFNDITKLNYSLAWDPALLHFTRIIDGGSLTGITYDSTGQTAQGKIGISWTGAATDLALNTVLLQVCYNAIGNAGSTAAIDLSDDPTMRMATADDGSGSQTLTLLGQSGQVEIIGSGGFQFIGTEEEGFMGDTVCAYVKYNGFNKILGIQYAMQWDTSVVQLVSRNPVPGFPIQTDYGISNATTVTVSWNDLFGSGVTLGNDTTHMEFCFELVGEPGEMSPFDFVEIPTTPPGAIEVVGNDDNNQTISVPFTIDNGKITILAPANDLDATAAITDVVCFGESTGAIDLTVTGGTAPYTFNWDPPASTEDLTDIPAGTYDVTITDADSNTFTASYTVADGSEITLSFATTDASCAGGDGAIDLTVNGGTAPFTYLWDPMASTEDLTNLDAGDYDVTVTDANGCTQMGSATVNQANNDITLSFSTTDASCAGGDGAVDLTVNGGTAPFTYLWDPMASTEDLTNVDAGTYAVTVTDANGCTQTGSATVNQINNDITLSFSTTDASCAGGDGAVDLTVNGGTAPFTYSWDPPASTEDLANLNAGTYAVTVTDANGCTQTGSATVNQANNDITLSFTTTDASCAGGDGGVNLTVNGGTAPFTYNWSNTAMTEDLTGVNGGTYSVTVTDANNCTQTGSATVNQSGDLSATFTKADARCFGNCNGSVDVTVSTGVAPYTYDWDDDSFDGMEDLSGLCAGNYNVTITDNGGCVTNLSITITQPDELDINGTVGNISCNGLDNGTINLNVSGGNGGYSYQWSGGLAAVQNQSGLSAGTYSVTVSDSRGCNDVATFTITEPDPIVINGSVTHQSQVGMDDGMIVLTVTGGDMSYSYSWDNGATTATISNLAPGAYTVTVTDGSGCTEEATFNINSASAPTIMIVSVTNPSCNGANDGAIQVNVTGGSPAYTYNWSNLAVTEDISGLVADTYILTVTDASGTTAVSPPITLTEPAAINIGFNKTDVSCAGNDDGTIQLMVTGGTTFGGVYNYSWNPPITVNQPNVSGLAAGVYTPTVTDANGCTATTSITIEGSTDITINLVNIDDLSCGDGADGSIDVSVTGGSEPYIYNWSSGGNTEDIDGLTARDYQLTVTDANGCEAVSALFTVGAPTPITIDNIDVTDLICADVIEGAIDITVSGGQSPYSYQWSNCDTGTPISGAEDLVNLNAGNYCVVITDAAGCTFTSNDIFVDGPTPLDIDFNVNNTSALNDDGAINLTVSGGTSPYSYNWVTTASGSGLIPSNEDQFNLTPGFYFVTITDANGCNANIDSIQVEGLLLATGVVTDVSCFGADDGAIDLTIEGGNPPFNYQWDNDDMDRTQDLANLPAGTYSVTIIDRFGTEIVRTFDVTQPDEIILTSTFTNISGNNCNGSIDLSVSGGMPGYTYQWSNGATSQDIRDLCKGAYTVEVTDRNGCVVTSAPIGIGEANLAFSRNLDVSEVSCAGEEDACVTISIVGGCGPYNYQGSNGNFVNQTDDLQVEICDFGVGLHSIIVTDINGTRIQQAFTVEEPDPITASVDNISNNTAEDGQACNGTINLGTPVGGTAPYTYLWNTGAISQDLQGLCELLSPYSVTITDANGCTAVVDGIEVRKITVSVSDEVCAGECNGEVNLSISGSDGPFTYSWDDGSTNALRTNLCAGTYGYTITNAQGDIIQTATITVLGPNSPLAITDVFPLDPQGANDDGSIDVDVDGGWGGYTFSWTGPGGFTSSQEDIDQLADGRYRLVVTDANGCQVDTTVTLNAQILTLLDVRSQLRSTCSGDCDAFISLEGIGGGAAPYTYQWSNGGTTSGITDLCEGTYLVTITDANGLSNVFDFDVTEPAPIVVEFLKSPGSATANVSGGTAPFTFQWNDSNNTTGAQLSGVRAGTYAVFVTDANGCTGTFPVEVDGDQEDGDCREVREVITPNGDGNNDEFIVLCDANITLRVMIFNRWSQLVYESDNYNQDWQGTDRRGEVLPEGGYFYILEYNDPQTNLPVQTKGHLTILR